MSWGHWSGDYDPPAGPPKYWAGVREGLVGVRREVRPALAKAAQRLAYRIDPGVPVIMERSDGELEIWARGIVLARITSGSVAGRRYGREPGR